LLYPPKSERYFVVTFQSPTFAYMDRVPELSLLDGLIRILEGLFPRTVAADRAGLDEPILALWPLRPRAFAFIDRETINEDAGLHGGREGECLSLYRIDLCGFTRAVVGRTRVSVVDGAAGETALPDRQGHGGAFAFGVVDRNRIVGIALNAARGERVGIEGAAERHEELNVLAVEGSRTCLDGG
jgi:hypothetical protein